jgi:hypothetical protein
MITENTRTPIGSSLLRPIGYAYESCRAIIYVVVHTIAVLRKSRAASTKLASTDLKANVSVSPSHGKSVINKMRTHSELVSTITAILPARRIVLATRFT